jgi:hypothetical protein
MVQGSKVMKLSPRQGRKQRGQLFFNSDSINANAIKGTMNAEL